MDTLHEHELISVLYNYCINKKGLFPDLTLKKGKSKPYSRAVDNSQT